MDNVKEAFIRVREDIENLKYELDNLKLFVLDSKEKMKEIFELIEKLDSKLVLNKIENSSIKEKDKQTNKQKNFSDLSYNKTNNLKKRNITPLNGQNEGISTGNGGVQTNRQTDKQTDQQTQNELDNAIKILGSLDDFKKELRLKFKKLTNQEILVFSTIYQIEEERGYTNYKLLAERLNLSESSIRDYVRRLLRKNVPLEKRKINNKEVKIIISPNLRKIASLETILNLRNL